jgi:hypothetical protein
VISFVFIFKLLHKIRADESDTKNKSMKGGFLSTEERILSTCFYGILEDNPAEILYLSSLRGVSNNLLMLL